MRKHPIIIGLALLALLGGIFAALAIGIGSVSGKGRSFSLAPQVGIVPVEGVVANAKPVVEQLDEFRKDESIKAVVLRIDSPGGAVAPSEEIYEAVRALRQKKPVVASLGTIAASGGYLIACSAGKIVANAGTITGSISAVMHFPNAEELLKKIGIKSSVIKSGKFKDIGSPTREMTAEEKALLQGLVDDIYEHLLDVIARDRSLKREQLREIADGRIFTGRQAKKMGLVDEIGDLSAAVRLAGKMAGLTGTPEAVYPTPKKKSLWEMMISNAVSTALREWGHALPGTTPTGLYSVYTPAEGRLP